jgi:hypothetical protein
MKRLALLGSLPAASLAYWAVGNLSWDATKAAARAARGALHRTLPEASEELAETILRLGVPFRISNGTTNKLAQLAGRSGPSPYMQAASRDVSSYILGSVADRTEIEIVEGQDSVGAIVENRSDALLLGGPVSNDLSSYITGHDYEPIVQDGKPLRLPKFIGRDGRLRWGFYCGDEGFGMHGGKRLRALRYENNELQSRPRYGIIDDPQRRELRLLPVDRHGRLEEEALLITRTRSPWAKGFYTTSIGGVHGHSAVAFAYNVENSLEELRRLVGDAKEFQVFVPAPLIHYDRTRTTEARLDWGRAEKFVLDS